MYSRFEVNVVLRRRPVRRWRLRGRRGQVSAVATILGLLLVVTFIANYLTTTLPQQMSVNDLNHIVEVQDQVGRLQALLYAASQAHAIGAQFTQPITLGSAGQPPFASADTASVGPVTGASSFSTSLTGPLVYDPPTASPAGGRLGGCTYTSPTLTCAAGWHNLTYNISAATPTSYSVSTSLGTYHLNISDSGTSSAAKSTITVTASGSGPLDLFLLGSNDTVTLSLATATTAVQVIVLGSNDSLAITNTGLYPSSVSLYEVGNYDANTFTIGTNLSYVASIFGIHDTVAGATTAHSNSATTDTVYFVGFTSTTTACPNDDFASSDTVSVSSSEGSHIVTWNVSTSFTPTAVSHWTELVNIVTPASANCPFFSSSTIPLSLGGSAAGFDVHLINTYVPSADIAFDEGGVVYTQLGGTPIMLDPPSISATVVAGAVTALTIWFPAFTGSIATDSGVSTTEISTRLLSVDNIALTPSSGTWLALNSNIVLTILTPFAAAWAGYFNSTSPFESEWNCVGPTAACIGPYNTNGPLGTITLTVPTSSALVAVNIQVATFSIALV